MTMPPRNKRKERPSSEPQQSSSPQHDPQIPSSYSSAIDSFFSTKPLALPPGYRFVPKDEELILILCYLKHYVQGNKNSWPNSPVHHVNIYKSNPQQLSEEFEKGNEEEWFYISERTKIHKGGKNMKRDDNSGYWEGRSTEKINAGQGVVGYKTSLAYYVGKQPNGVKSDWLMHEYWFESSHDDDKVDYALCKIYLNPTGKKKKKAEEEEKRKQKIEEDVAIAGVEPLEKEAEQQTFNVECQQLHQPHFSPAPLDYYQLQRHDLTYQQLHQPQFSPAPLDSYQSQHHGVEYQQLHQPQFWPAPMDSYQLQSHDIAYQQPHFWPAPMDSYQPQPYEISYQQPLMLEGTHGDIPQQQQQQQGTLIPPLPQGQDSGFGMVMTPQSNDNNNNMWVPNQDEWLDDAFFDVNNDFFMTSLDISDDEFVDIDEVLKDPDEGNDKLD